VKVQSIEVATHDRLLTPNEVCERLGVSMRWLRRAVTEGRIDRVKMGHLNRFRESYIDGLVENGLPVED
jgi:excisionase family DNA binding protein